MPPEKPKLNAQAHYASVNGLNMYYEDVGAGRPLVLLHGGGSTAQTSFGAVMPALARTHRVIAPEQQAHGHTADIDRPLTFAQMADDTAALLEQLGVREVDVMGFSNGGVTALEFALRHRERVGKIVICSSFYARAGLPESLWQGIAHATAANMPPVLYEAFLAAAPSADAVPRMFSRQVSLMNGFNDIPEASLHGLQIPALVLVGDADVMSVEHTAQLARLLPNAKLCVMPGSGHGTYLATAEGAKPGSVLPALTLQLLDEFLSGKM